MVLQRTFGNVLTSSSSGIGGLLATEQYRKKFPAIPTRIRYTWSSLLIRKWIGMKMSRLKYFQRIFWDVNELHYKIHRVVNRLFNYSYLFNPNTRLVRFELNVKYHHTILNQIVPCQLPN
jgi:hypothetical protein